jgi:hypothetical protein
MRGFTEKIEFLNAIAVKVCPKTSVLSSQAPKNLLFR